MSANNVAALPSRSTQTLSEPGGEPPADPNAPPAPAPFDPNALTETMQALQQQNQQTQQLVQSLAQQNQQQNDVFANMNTTMQTMGERLQRTNEPAAPNPAANPALQLNDREREELGTSVEGINKLIDQRVLARQDEIVQQAAAVNAPRLQTLEQTLATTQQQLEAANQRLGETYQAQAFNTAAMHSIDLSTLDKNQEWNAFLGQTADPVTGVTYGQHLQGAMDDQRPAMFTKLLQQYANSIKTEAPKTGIPQPASPASNGTHPAPTTGGEAQMADLQKQYMDVSKQARELTTARLRQQMTDMDYQQKSQPLQNKMFEIQAQIQQLTNPT